MAASGSISYVDTSVIVSSLVERERFHVACSGLFVTGGLRTRVHTLGEVFSTLTGGRFHLRLPASVVMEVIDKSILPFVELVGLSGTDCVAALRETESRGVRGGAVHDYLHLAAARSCGATQLYTLDDSNFRAFHRPGDPAIVHPNAP